MRKALVAGIVGIGLLAGCMTNGLQMNIINNSDDKPEFLMGEITQVKALKSITFVAENFTVSCEGVSPDGNVQLGLTHDIYTHQFPISCSDGRDGTVRLRIRVGGGSIRGTGIGQMSDGSDVRISIGETSGGIVW